MTLFDLNPLGDLGTFGLPKLMEESFESRVRKVRIERTWEMPSIHTFNMKTVGELLSREMTGIWADPFCGSYSPANLRNDANTEIVDATSHLDGLEFLRTIPDQSMDGVLFDPPYSVEQALRKYKPVQNGTAGRAEYWAKCKDEIRRIVRHGGKAICFAWDSNGIGKKRGFALEKILLICHGACHNDTIITVETKALA